jgi:hypothetical protein
MRRVFLTLSSSPAPPSFLFPFPSTQHNCRAQGEDGGFFLRCRRRNERSTESPHLARDVYNAVTHFCSQKAPMQTLWIKTQAFLPNKNMPVQIGHWRSPEESGSLMISMKKRIKRSLTSLEVF